LSLQTILENTLKAYNTNHKLELTYDENKGENFKVLKILNDQGGSLRQVKCNKSQAIDIINFMSLYLDTVQEKSKEVKE